MKFSPKTLTSLLVFAILALSYQTYALASLSQKVAQAQMVFATTSTVSFDSSAPDMVGGC